RKLDDLRPHATRRCARRRCWSYTTARRGGRGDEGIPAGRAANPPPLAALLDEDDVPANEAAGRAAAAIAGAGVHVSEATTGRCNLHAAADGLVLVDRPRIDRPNPVDERGTTGT